ncbi:MAG TPA: transglutaminase [Coriobacteriia bacterium]|nr:transglutaminase [Coriobacteriia bacterium]
MSSGKRGMKATKSCEGGGVGVSHGIALKVGVAALVLCSALLLTSCDGTIEMEGLFGEAPALTADVSADDPSRANPGAPRDTTPVVLVAEQPGIATYDHDKATLDYSNVAAGYLCVRNNMAGVKVMVIMTVPDGNQYKYPITESGVFQTIPLSRGNGVYQVDVYENLYGDSYAAIFTQQVDVALADEYGAFLYPNTVVRFSDGDEAVTLSRQLATNATSDVEVVDQIYMWVVQNIEYDYEKAETVAPGYLPDNADTLRTKTGICFDYAALMAAMLRAQSLPTKLDVGYCGEAYHAWIEVYTRDAGWIRKKIEFPGGAYVRLDPTFDSAGKGTGDVSRLVGDGRTYQPMFYY